jgi:hypothetical protein
MKIKSLYSKPQSQVQPVSEVFGRIVCEVQLTWNESIHSDPVLLCFQQAFT